jgi:hypothetical protein
MFTWVDDIRELYRLNAARLNEWDERLPLDQQSSAFDERQHELVTKLSEMQARCEAPLQEPALHLAQQKVLSSLQNHWDGLTVFVTRPEVAMDNNTAERILRNPVAGRKNYYGSGSVWSAHFAAMMFSVLQTLLLWGLNPHHGLSAFLQACAENGGQSPADLSPFVPWQMSAERREALSRPLPMMVPALGGLTQEQLRAPLFEPGGALSALSSETQDQLYDEARGWPPYSSAQVPMWRGETATCHCAAISFEDSICRASGSASPPFTTFSSPGGTGRRQQALFRSEAALNVCGDIGIGGAGTCVAESASKSIKWPTA